MSRLTVRTAVYVALLLILFEGVAPTLITRGAEWALSGNFGSPVTVELGAFPRAKMALGRFDQVRLIFRDFPVAGVTLERLILDLQPVQVDLGALFLTQQLRLRAPLGARVRAELGEDEFAAYWLPTAGSPGTGWVEFGETQLALQLRYRILGRDLTVRVEAEPEIVATADGQELRLRPVTIYVEDRELPAPLRAAVLSYLQATALTVSLDWGLEVRWTDVQVRPGLLVLEGVLQRETEEFQLPIPSR